MKVGRIYMIGFSGSNDEEVHDGIRSLRLKYLKKGVLSDCIITTFINQNTVYYQVLKNKGALKENAIKNATAVANKGTAPEYEKGIGDTDFEKILNLKDLSSEVKGGVGIYFFFHGTPGNADIANNVLVYITCELMKLHSSRAVRKVVFVTCGFANNIIPNGFGTAKTTDLLQKYATALHRATAQKCDLPKLAGYIDGIFMDKTGKKFSDKNYTDPIKGKNDKKVAFLLDSENKYYRVMLNGDRSEWTDSMI